MVADPKAIILEFLGNLPATISEHILSLCLMGFEVYPIDDEAPDLLKLIPALMETRVPSLEGYKCAMVASVIDVALADPGFDSEKFFQELSDNTGSMVFSRAAAQAPLKKRHIEAARMEFARLREGPLSVGSLRDWSSVRFGAGVD
jgi:hypothetical protein